MMMMIVRLVCGFFSWFHRRGEIIWDTHQVQQFYLATQNTHNMLLFLPSSSSSLFFSFFSCLLLNKNNQKRNVYHMYLLANAYNNLNPKDKWFSFNFKWNYGAHKYFVDFWCCYCCCRCCWFLVRFSSAVGSVWRTTNKFFSVQYISESIRLYCIDNRRNGKLRRANKYSNILKLMKFLTERIFSLILTDLLWCRK